MEKCEGKRRMFRRNSYGTFKCGRKATVRVETHVGFTEHHRCCDSDECLAYISSGYPATVTPIAKSA